MALADWRPAADPHLHVVQGTPTPRLRVEAHQQSPHQERSIHWTDNITFPRSLWKHLQSLSKRRNFQRFSPKQSRRLVAHHNQLHLAGFPPPDSHFRPEIGISWEHYASDGAGPPGNPLSWSPRHVHLPLVKKRQAKTDPAALSAGVLGYHGKTTSPADMTKEVVGLVYWSLFRRFTLGGPVAGLILAFAVL